MVKSKQSNISVTRLSPEDIIFSVQGKKKMLYLFT